MTFPFTLEVLLPGSEGPDRDSAVRLSKEEGMRDKWGYWRFPFTELYLPSNPYAKMTPRLPDGNLVSSRKKVPDLDNEVRINKGKPDGLFSRPTG